MTTTTTMSPFDGDDHTYLTLSEVARILRVPVNTLRWWRQRDEGPPFFKLGRKLVITKRDLRRWIDKQKGRPDADA